MSIEETNEFLVWAVIFYLDGKVEEVIVPIMDALLIAESTVLNIEKVDIKVYDDDS